MTAELLRGVREEDLSRWVEILVGPRHGQAHPEQLARTGKRLAEEFATFGFRVHCEPFPYMGRPYFNVVATLPGSVPDRPGLLLGAHYDAIDGSPGADDNASGVAVLLAAAKALSQLKPAASLQFVGFSLEEPQTGLDSYRHGSRHFAQQAWSRGRRYDGVFILEMVGYTDHRPGSQTVPWGILKTIPTVGDFLGVIGNRRSRPLLARLEDAATRYVPDLTLVTYWVFLRGLLIPVSRWSDHAPFWDHGYPAMMLTDTAFLRNPHYHRPTDTPETLDYPFMARVARTLIATVAQLAQ
ncbi:MAG: M28 family peptidase [Candidatus Methylomirabilales bacterium]